MKIENNIKIKNRKYIIYRTKNINIKLLSGPEANKTEMF